MTTDTTTEDSTVAATEYTPTPGGTPYQQLAFLRIHDRAVEALLAGQHDATQLGLDGHKAQAHAVDAVLAAVGPAYAAAAINRVATDLVKEVDEDTFVALDSVAAALDLEVVEDLDGANGTGDDGPIIRVFRRTDGWLFGGSRTVEPCTSNFHREQDGRPACTADAVWKVVEDHGMHLTISFWCDGDFPAEHRHLAEGL